MSLLATTPCVQGPKGAIMGRASLSRHYVLTIELYDECLSIDIAALDDRYLLRLFTHSLHEVTAWKNGRKRER